MKLCRTCGHLLPLTDYHRDKSAPDGHRHECKACAGERRLQWQRDNREYNRAYQRQWNAENAEQVREGKRKWKAEHPERVALYARRSYQRRVYGHPMEDL